MIHGTETATVVLGDSLAEPGTGWYAHYRHRRVRGTSWRCWDVREAIRTRQAAWLEQIDTWHAELCRRAENCTPQWWLNPGARLTPWYPVDLKALLFAAAIAEFVREHPGATLQLLAPPEQLCLYLEEWAAGEPTVQVRTSLPRPAASGPAAARAADARPAVRAIVSAGLRRLFASPLGGRRVPAATLIFSHTLDAALMAEVGDHFFGRMLDGADTQSAAVHWVYLLSSFRQRTRIRDYCASIGRAISFDYEHVRLFDLPAVLWACRRIRRALRPLGNDLPVLSVGPLSTRLFPRLFWDSAVDGYWPVSELMVQRIMARAVRGSSPAAVMYPYEEKGLERALLVACAASHAKPRTVAFAHAVYNQGHRYVRQPPASRRPQPDVIAATGPAAARWLHEWAGVSATRLAVVGSPRHADAAAPHAEVDARALRILLLVGYGTEINVLATFVEAVPDVLTGCELTIRRYPHAWVSEQDEGIARLEALGVRARIESGPLAAQVAASHVVMYCSTSAGIEAMLAGRVTIRVALQDFFDADPTEGKDDEADAGAIFRCTDAAQLRERLSWVASLDAEGYRRTVARQRQFATQIYARADQSALVDLLLISRAT